VFVGLALSVALSGCAFGSRALERSYGPYYESVRHADEEELLRNLVHMRYNESPSSLDVSSIASQYELSGQAEARPFFVSPNPSNSNVIFKTFTSILPDVLLQGAIRPTISLVPANDGEATRQFFTPINAENLAFLIQTGWPTTALLRLWVEQMNGVSNPHPGSGPNCDEVADPARFERILELLQSAGDRELISIRSDERVTEVSGPLPPGTATAAAAVEAAKAGLEIQPRGDGKTWAVVRRERHLVVAITPGVEADPELAELEGLLNLVPGRSRYDLVVVPGRTPDPLNHPAPPSIALHITPRSTAQVFLYLANGVEVPAEHVSAGLVCPAHGADGLAATGGLFAVHTAKGCKAPRNAYLAVKCRGWWYYIDCQDAQSKATFALVLQLERLDLRRRPPGGGPLLTLPAGR
jgi:hypothetical protein